MKKVINYPQELIGETFIFNNGVYLITGYGYTQSDKDRMKITMVEGVRKDVYIQNPIDFWRCWNDKLTNIDCTALLTFNS